MNKKYIKMNNNKNYLSLGNIFNIIKLIANNKESAMQTELFCTIFNINNINNTTVNNYCIGYRAIGIEYKKIFLDMYHKYIIDNKIFIDIVLRVLNILDDCIYISNDKSLELINSNCKLCEVIEKCILIAKTDINISDDFIDSLEKKVSENNLYGTFIEILNYAILKNKQPIFNQDIKINLDNELKEYLKINLYEGISYITSLKELSKRNNMYACAELGSLEYSGVISGNKDLKKCFNYYLIAANKNHPKACWMIANLVLTKNINIISYDDALNFLNRAIEFGSIAALNTKGNCYKKEGNLDKALEYYIKASEYSYVYAYNNIGLIYEDKKDYVEALKYFKISADLGESWAMNKVGELYRLNNNLKDAYLYYKSSIEAPVNERNYFGYYNLAKYYYLVGDSELGIEKDIELAKEYLIIASNNGIKEAKDLLENL